MIYTADFETTTDLEDCRVWAWALCNVNNTDEFVFGNSVQTLMDWCSKKRNLTLYFHNLKFDGEFILQWLLHNGFTEIIENGGKAAFTAKSFKTLISDMGQFYSIEICFSRNKSELYKVKILDSLKLLPFSIDQMAKTFGLPISKLEIDYRAKREIGHILTEEEKAYIKNDVAIAAMALKALFDMGLTKMTTASNALNEYKTLMGNRFKYWFPPPQYDAEIRQAYKGGFTYLSPRYADKDVGNGIVLDVNSLYPAMMYYKPLPYDEGVFYDGKYQQDNEYPLYIQIVRVSFELKPKHIPTIQIKGNLSFVSTEYLESSNGEIVALALTSPDLELLLSHYNCDYIEYVCGWKFKAGTAAFRKYIDKWIGVKIEATKEGNKGKRAIAKLMLNSLYGKFATNPKCRSKHPYLGENGEIKYQLGEEEERAPIYIPVAAFITAWGRYTTITSAQKVYDRFIYADTDSLHLEGTDFPEGLDIDDVKLGAWKVESEFTRARFLHQKCYIEEIGNELKITCAGMPKSCYPYVTWENFHPNASYKGKLKPQHVNGGIVLVDTPMTIREKK